MDINRINNAIRIVEYAINKNTSVKKACIENGFGSTYVKNIKAKIIEKYDKGLVGKSEYDSFFNVYDKYISFNKKEPMVGKNILGNKLSKEEKNNKLDINYSSNSSYPKGHIKTLEDLLVKCEVDKDEWSVKDYLVNKWDVTSWKNNFAQTIENFQVKAR